MSTSGVIACTHRGSTYKMFRFFTEDNGEGLAILAPPKYSDVRDRRCVLQKITPNSAGSNRWHLTIPAGDSFSQSDDGIMLKFDPDNSGLQVYEAQAETNDVKMNWHGDGNFHISGSGIPRRASNVFAGTGVDRHFVVPSTKPGGTARVEVEGLILGVVCLKTVRRFLHRDNVLTNNSEPVISLTVDDAERMEPNAVFLCRLRSISGVTVEPKVTAIEHGGLRHAIASCIRETLLKGAQGRIDMDEKTAQLLAIQDKDNRKTFFLCYACNLNQRIWRGHGQEDWFIGSAPGVNGEILRMTVGERTRW